MAIPSRVIIASGSVFLSLTWPIVALRMYCRAVLLRTIGLDDVFMLATLIVFTVYTATQIYGATVGIGRRHDTLTADDISISYKIWLSGECLNILCTCLLKISVGYFLLRFTISRTHRWIVLLLMASTVVFGITYLTFVLLQCQPIRIYWVQGPRTPGKCWPDRVIYAMTISAAVLNTGADWIFGILPYFMVRSMNLPTRTKVVVVGILSIAAVGSSATIVRSVYIPSLLDGEDFLYHTSAFAFWSTIEPGMGIIAASIATLRPLVHLVMTKLGRTEFGQERERRRLRQMAPRDETERQRRAVSAARAMGRRLPSSNKNSTVLLGVQDETTSHSKASTGIIRHGSVS